MGRPRQHGGLRRRQFLQVLAEIDLGRRGEAVGALAKVNLVDVQLENLVLAEIVLDLEGQQHLQHLAGDGLLAGQEEIARHLLGNGAGPLALAAARHVHHHRPQEPQGIHPAMLIEALVFRRQDGVLHHGRHILDGHEGAPLLAEFTDQEAIRRIDAQGLLGPVIRKNVECRQGRIGKHRHHAGKGRHEETQGSKGEQGIQEPAGTRIQGGSPGGKSTAGDYRTYPPLIRPCVAPNPGWRRAARPCVGPFPFASRRTPQTPGLGRIGSKPLLRQNNSKQNPLQQSKVVDSISSSSVTLGCNPG